MQCARQRRRQYRRRVRMATSVRIAQLRYRPLPVTDSVLQGISCRSFRKSNETICKSGSLFERLPVVVFQNSGLIDLVTF